MPEGCVGKIRGVVAEHVCRRYQRDWGRDFGTVNLESRALYTLATSRWQGRCGRGSSSIRPLDALGEATGDRHNVKLIRGLIYS